MDLRVIDEEAQSLADQMLGDEHQRTLANVVGARLEREADQADAALARSEHLGDRAVEMDAVRLQHAAEHRQLHVSRPGEMQRRAQILRQAGAAERKAGLEVRPGNVELRVLADEVHHLEGVDAERLAEAGRLVRERDLERVEIVAAVLDHLRGAYRGGEELARQVPEEPAKRFHRCRRVRAHDRVAAAGRSRAATSPRAGTPAGSRRGSRPRPSSPTLARSPAAARPPPFRERPWSERRTRATPACRASRRRARARCGAAPTGPGCRSARTACRRR